MNKNTFSETAVYEIRVRGILKQQWNHWFEGMTITTDSDRGETIISGEVIDQAALHGLLNKIRDLGVPLLALQQLEGEK